MSATGVGVTDRRWGALFGGGGALWGLTVWRPSPLTFQRAAEV
jgi:hypothetical protein